MKILSVVSADLFHFLPLKQAIQLENKAAHAIVHRDLDKSNDYIDVIDHKKTFKTLFKVLPEKFIFQWIGRTRSSGMQGVGYLSFLIRKEANPTVKMPDGIFITAYDQKMNTRECLGEWFNKSKKWNKKQKVIY